MIESQYLAELSAPTIKSQDSLFDRLRASNLFRSYRDGFQKLTGLPLELRPANPDRFTGASEGVRQNRFCHLLNRGENKCQQCLLANRCLATREGREVHSMSCFADMQETAVPVMQGGTVVAHLSTGQIFHAKPSKERFTEIWSSLDLDGESVSEAELSEAYLATRVIEAKKYQAMVTLLAAFSLQMSELAGHLILELRDKQSDAMACARDYIEENLTEPIHLNEVAEKVNMSPFYFCRKFKESSGVTLTSYVTCRRIALAQEILQHTVRQVSEIAFEVGFQSLSQFNRSFHKVTGQSPTAFRRHMLAA